jgi:hypothetical protein
MKPTRKVALTNVTATGHAAAAQGQGAKPTRDPAAKEDANKREYKRKTVTKSAK